MHSRRRYHLLFLTCALLGPVGCHQANLVESPLFLPGREGSDNRSALNRPDGLQQTAATETPNAKSTSTPTTSPVAPAESLKRLTLGPLTGGYDGDEQPGDEALLVVLEPRDATDHPVPVVGNLQIIALQTSPEGVKSTLCVWEMTTEELRTHWKSGPSASGYSLILPWKAWPMHEQLRVVARMCVTGGKLFEVDKDVRVHLAPTAARSAQTPLPLPPNPIFVEPVSHQTWAQPLAGAVRLLRPVPLRDDE